MCFSPELQPYVTEYILPAPWDAGNEVFVGIDAALKHTGVCVLYGDTVHLYLITIPAKHRDIANFLILNEVSAAIHNALPRPPRFVVFEEALHAGSGDPITLAQAAMALRISLSRSADTQEIPVNVSTLKKFGCELSGAGKDPMIEAAQGRVPGFPEQDDLADAFHLANLGRQLHFRAPRTRKQAEVLHTVTPTPNTYPTR